MKKLTSAVVASSLVLGLVGSAFAAPSTEQVNDAFARMSAYGIAQGKLMADGSVDPALGDTLTRAELATVLARGFGAEETAKLLMGAKSFDDVATNEWYSGYVALIKNMAEKKNIAVGYEDGTFRPTQNVTAIEALAFVMKLLGVQPGTGANWVADTVAAAKDAGVITDADAEAYLADPNGAATRGLAFALADAIFSTYEVAEGKTVYTTYVDDEAPVITLNTPAEPTTANATYSVAGKVEGAVALFYGTDEITPNEDGTFNLEVNLEVGPNTITFSAVDLAGNVTTESFSLARNAGAAASVKAALSSTEVAAGGTAELTYSVVDANDVELNVAASDVQVTVAGDIGTVTDGVFTASTTAGSGTITLTYGELSPTTIDVKVVAAEMASIEASTESVAPGTAVTLVAKDAYGNVVEGATFSESSADAFLEGSTFTATKAGQYTVTATKGEQSIEGTIGVFGDVADLVIEAPTTMVANGETKYNITVKATDEAGNLVKSFDGEVALTSDLTVTDTTVEAVDGVATFEVKVPEGLDNIELDLVATHKDFKGEATFTAAAQTASKIKLSAGSYLGINDNSPEFSGSVKVLDQEGVAMKTGDTWEVSLKLSGPAYFNSDEDKEVTIDATGIGESFDLIPVDSNTEGNVTVTATAAGLESATATVKAAYAYAPHNLVVTPISTKAAKANETGVYIFKVGLTDRNGVPVTSNGDYDVTLTFDTASYAQLSIMHAAASELVDETAEVTGSLDSKKGYEVSFADGDNFIYVGVTAGKLTGDVSFTAESDDLTSANGTVAFVADELAGIEFKSAALNVLPNTETELSFQLVDGSGNKVAESMKVELTTEDAELKIGGKSTQVVSTDATGKGTAKVKVASYSASTTLLATVDGNKDGDYDDVEDFTQDLILAVVPSVAKTISVTAYDDEGNRKTTYENGDTIEIRVTVTDNGGLPLTVDDYDGDVNLQLGGIKFGTDIVETDLFTDDDDNTNDYLAFAWDTEGRYWYTTVTAKKAGTLSFKVSDSSSIYDVEGSRSVSVRAGQPYGFAIKEAYSSGTTVDAKYGKVTAYTVQVVDIDGNLVAPSKVSSAIDVTASLTGLTGSYAIVRTSEIGGGSGTLDFQVPKNKNSVTIYVVTDSTTDLTLDLDATDIDPGTEGDQNGAGSVTVNITNIPE